MMSVVGLATQLGTVNYAPLKLNNDVVAGLGV
jgi:hypothetical protein